MNDIKKRIGKNPEANRKKLCKKFKNDNEFAIKFVNKYPEYQHFVKHFINEPSSVYHWGRNIGNQDFMKHRITDSQWVYYWGCYIGDREFMKHKITDSQWAYLWAYYIGDKDYMKHKITDEEDAYRWAQNIGDINDMKKVIEKKGGQYWIYLWNEEFEDNQIH